MAEAQINFSGKSGLIGIVVLIGVILARVMSLGDSDDPKLRDAIRGELRNDLAGEILEATAAIEDGDEDAAQRAMALSDSDNIRIYATSVSKPLLSFSSSADAVVKIDYRLPEGERQSAYWRFNHSLIGGWQYRGRSSAALYYLNFM